MNVVSIHLGSAIHHICHVVRLITIGGHGPRIFIHVTKVWVYK